jgi:Fe-S cluster assembly protein SufD
MFNINYNPKMYAEAQSTEVLDRRLLAWKQMQQDGLPTKKDEDWRYTDFKKWVTKLNFSLEPMERCCNIVESEIQKYLDNEFVSMIFIDGFFNTELSNVSACIDKGIKIDDIHKTILDNTDSSLSRAKCFNDAFFSSGVQIQVPTGVDIKLEYIYITTVSSEKHVRCSKNTLNISGGANVSITEKYISLTDNPVLINSDYSINLLDNASLKWFLEVDSKQGNLINIGRLEVNQFKDSNFEYFNLFSGGALNRYELDVKLNASGAFAKIDGIFITTGSMNVDNNIKVTHNASHTTSDVCFKGIASGKSSATFNAKAIVKKGLKAIKALQSNKNLLMNNTATVNTKPELEIYSDDVVCSHGATIGQIDYNLVFYFQSRGIPYNDAIKMLTVAFLMDVLDRQSICGSKKELLSNKVNEYSSKII